MQPRYEHTCKACKFLGQYKEYDLYYCSTHSRRPTIVARFGKEEDYTSGMNFAMSGMDYALAVGLSYAKIQGHYSDIKEVLLLPEDQKELFTVNGSAGVEGDRLFWPVRAFRAKHSAETYADACIKQAALWKANNSDTSSPPYNWSALDPNMICTGRVTYYVQTLPIALRPEELSSHWEQCPICRGQVYETPDGRICENGHEAL